MVVVVEEGWRRGIVSITTSAACICKGCFAVAELVMIHHHQQHVLCAHVVIVGPHAQPAPAARCCLLGMMLSEWLCLCSCSSSSAYLAGPWCRRHSGLLL